MKYFIFLLLFSITTQSQNIVVLDSETKVPVPFATVLLLQNGKLIYGNYCGQDGNINIDASKNFDTVEFSCIGYENKQNKRIDITDTIFLQRQAYELNEVVISGINKIETIGYNSNKKSTFRGIDKGGIGAVYIENIHKKTMLIKSFLFTPVNTEKRKAYRLHFYKPDGNAMWPGDEILNENITGFIEARTKGAVEIDISSYAIEIPVEGIYVGIESLGICDSNGNILPDENKTGLSYEVFQTENPIYCTQPGFFKSVGWINMTDWLIKDMKASFDAKPRKKDLVAPKFGIKISVPTP